MRFRFRWAEHALRYLSELTVAGLIEQRLQTLPNSLPSLYDETFSRMGDRRRGDEMTVMQNAICFLLALRTELSADGFLEALSFTSDSMLRLTRNQLVELSMSYIVYDTELDTFRFAHTSVLEYFQQNETFDGAKCNAILALGCLRLLCRGRLRDLSHVSFVSQKSYFEHFGWFSLYAIKNWPYHLDGSIPHRAMEPLKSTIRNFMFKRSNGTTPLAYWLSAIWILLHTWWSKDFWHRSPDFCFLPVEMAQTSHERDPRWWTVAAKPIYIACALDIHDVIDRCLQEDPGALEATCVPLHAIMNHNQRMGYYQSPRNVLDLVRGPGKYDAMIGLLGRGAEVSISNIRRACSANDLKCLDLLLQHYGSMKVQNHDFLHDAVDKRRMELISLLLDHGMDPQRSIDDVTALDLAIEAGRPDIVMALTKHRPELRESTLHFSQIFSIARTGQAAELAKSLDTLPAGAGFQQHIGSCLCAVTELGDCNKIRVLLDRQADVRSAVSRRWRLYGRSVERRPLLAAIPSDFGGPSTLLLDMLFAAGLELNRDAEPRPSWAFFEGDQLMVGYDLASALPYPYKPPDMSEFFKDLDAVRDVDSEEVLAYPYNVFATSVTLDDINPTRGVNSSSNSSDWIPRLRKER